MNKASNMKEKLDKALSKHYYNAKTVGSFGGIHNLSKTSKKNRETVQHWLSTQDAYTLHKPVKYKYPRRKVIVGGVGHQWQADLVDVSNLAKYNNGVKYLLTCIDVFSRKAWVIPLKDKTETSLVKAFESIPDSLPMKLQTDKGTEFTNRKVQAWLNDHGVEFFTTENDDIKACLVERFNRTLKSKLWRYFTRKNCLSYMDILQDMVITYNHTPHRSIGMAPLDVDDTTLGQVWYRLYGDIPSEYKKPNLETGDTVRISKTRRAFKKGYLPQWTEEIFTISKTQSTKPPTFCLKDWNGDDVKGSFYAQELQKINKPDNVYRIEEVLKEEKNRVFVKWLGYPDSFNSWVNKKDII